MNKKHLADYLATNVLTPQRIEELLTDFLNAELAAKRPKIDLLGAGIVEPSELPELEYFQEISKMFENTPNNVDKSLFTHLDKPNKTDIDRVTDEQL